MRIAIRLLRHIRQTNEIIIYPDEGEAAVIIQPGGKIPEYIHVENFRTGPTVDSKNIWIPRTTEML